jgi:hypothetical protein
LIKLEILDENGNGRDLVPEFIHDLGNPQGNASGVLNTAVTKNFYELYIDADSGTPTHYIKYGDYIYLRPKPNYNKTGGLRAYFNRPLVYMTTADTTKEPGVPVIHHHYLCRYAALPYLIENNLSQATSIAALIQQDERAIMEFYAQRDKDTNHRLIPHIEDCR